MAKKRKLLFLDTNILLDFYRCRTDAGISLLKHLDSIADCIIMTSQVEMEFKKHRQGAILESFKELKPPPSINRPGLFSDAKPFKALQSVHKKSEDLIKKLRKRLQTVFQNPTTHDEIYKVTQRLFTKQDAITLGRDKKIRFQIRRLAWKRFILGYPPRKQGDTSTGDAINWEWIVHCASETGADVVIVSRDSDYGVTLEGESYLNDWLLREFRERVSQKRKIQLFTKLTEALKQFQIKITKEEEKAEAVIAAHAFRFGKMADDQWKQWVSQLDPEEWENLMVVPQRVNPGSKLKTIASQTLDLETGVLTENPIPKDDSKT
jgi:hypothetical protein